MFSFTLKTRSSFNAFLSGLKTNAGLTLLKDNKVLSQSNQLGKRNETVSTTLDTGTTYFLRVSAHSGKARYQIKLSATVSPEPVSPGTIPSGSIGTGQRQLFYSDEFCYEYLPATVDGLSLLEASGVMAYFGDSPDLSNFLTAVNTQFGDAETKHAADIIVQQVSSQNGFEPSIGCPDRFFVNSHG